MVVAVGKYTELHNAYRVPQRHDVLHEDSTEQTN